MSADPFEGESRRLDDVYEARSYDADPAYTDVNPVYLHRVHSIERATLTALRKSGLSDRIQELRVLDYGCGNGRWLGRWLAWGVPGPNLCGTDIRPNAVQRAQHNFPSAQIETISEGAAPFPDGGFDVVNATLVFSSILDDDVRHAVASDMVRLLRPGGVLLVCDFTWNNPRNPDVRAVGLDELARLMPGLRPDFQRKLVLAPPVARRVVPTSWLLGDLLETLVPPLRTHMLVALRQPAG